jgi:hypothetical protein
MNALIAIYPLLPAYPPISENSPSGYSSILLQIRTYHGGVHPLDLYMRVHPQAAPSTEVAGANSFAPQAAARALENARQKASTAVRAAPDG